MKIVFNPPQPVEIEYNIMNKKQRRLKKKRQHLYQKSLVPQSEGIPFKPPVSPKSHHQMPLWTKTGELYQPVRLYYTVLKLPKILKTFGKFHCLEGTAERNQWKWLYTAETRDLVFEKAPRYLSKPIILGTISFKVADRMVLDVHSIERAFEAAAFFDRHLPRGSAKITHLSIVNRLFDAHETDHFAIEDRIDATSLPMDPILATLERLDAVQACKQPEREKQSMIEDILQERAATFFPEIEHLALHYSKRHLAQFWFLLGSRQYIAIQRWKGNMHYSLAAYLRDVLHGTNGLALPGKKFHKSHISSKKHQQPILS